MDRLLSHFIRLNQRHWRWFVLASVILTVGGLLVARHIELDTDLSRLLPQSSPSVKELKTIQKKSGGSYDLRLVLEGGPLEARLAAATAFTDFLHSKPELVRSAKFRTPKAFLEKYKYQLIPISSLDAIHGRVLEERKKYSEFLDPLGLEEEAPAASDGATKNPEDEKKELDRAKDLIKQLDDMQPVYQTKDGNYLAIRVVPASENLDIEKNRVILHEFEDLVAEFQFSRFHPDMKTHIYGSIPEHIDRFDSIADDVSFGGWGILLILVVVALYFRSLWCLPVLIPPLVAGLSIGLAGTYFKEGTLNSITVFLILVVFGMGIEFGIHLWARFLEERKRHSTFDSLLETWRSTGRATVTSSLALFSGYTLLTLSSFQGFAQFGRVAMILVSAVAVSFLFFMPSWIFFTEALRGRKIWPTSLAVFIQEGHFKVRWTNPRPAAILRVVSVALALAGAALCALFLRFDYQFDDGVKKAKSEARKALGNIFTERLKPSAVAVFPNAVEADRFLNYYEAHKNEYPDIPLASGLTSFLPTDQDKRIETLRTIADDIEYSWVKKVKDPVVGKALKEIKDRAYTMSPIKIEDLPAEMREPFLASDGSQDLLVYLYDIGGDTDGLKSMKFSDAVYDLEAKSGQNPILSGQEIIFADVVRRVVSEGPWLVIGMLLFVFAICWLDFRRLKHAVFTISPVILGFLITGIVLVARHIQINFYNMIALASLGSMVVDNSIHLYHAYLENKANGAKDAAQKATLFVAPTIVTCTITSILGYGGMLFANHRGISSLGFVADAGLLCCLVSSIVFFPAWLARK